MDYKQKPNDTFRKNVVLSKTATAQQSIKGFARIQSNPESIMSNYQVRQ